tara:strand:- start:737 stop:1228 length:492 start_codon:yes stop_codon:yes gene_type:complete
MTITSKNLFPNNELPDLPGLGGGGGGTNAITSKAKSKTLGTYMSDAFKISTIPARFLLGIKSPEDPLSKFAAPSTPEDKVSSAISSYNQSVQPDLTEQNNMKNISTNINQDVGQSRGVTTVIQPQVRTVTQQVPTPVPMRKQGKTQILPVGILMGNSIAKMIK